MTDTNFEDELRGRLSRAAAHASGPGRAPETPQESSEPRSHITGVRWLAGVAAALTLVVAGGIVVLRDDPSEVVTSDEPAQSNPQTTQPIDDTVQPDANAGQPGSLSDLLEPDTVRVMSAAPIEGRIAPAYVWTGTEMLVWGGSQPRPAGGENPLADGAAYNPVTDTWRLLSEAPIEGRAYAAVVWTGEEMLIWGGSSDGGFLDDGAAYNPATETWRTLSPSPLAGAMKSGVVWTGEEMLIVGGLNGNSSGSAYNPTTDSWRQLPDAPGTITPPYPQAVWTGDQAYFALGSGGMLGDLIFASYDPTSNLWRTIPHELAPTALPFLVWTGAEIVSITPALGLEQAAYDPATETWRQLPAVPADLPRVGPYSPIPWTGSEALLWAGGSTGLALDVSTGFWRNFPGGDLSERVDGALVWADGVLLAWGGFDSQPDGTAIGANDGIVYAPSVPAPTAADGTPIVEDDTSDVHIEATDLVFPMCTEEEVFSSPSDARRAELTALYDQLVAEGLHELDFFSISMRGERLQVGLDRRYGPTITWLASRVDTDDLCWFLLPPVGAFTAPPGLAQWLPVDVDASSTALTIRLDQQCGTSPDLVLPPVVTESDDRIEIAWSIEPRLGPVLSICLPPNEATIPLGNPIGDRRIVAAPAPVPLIVDRGEPFVVTYNPTGLGDETTIGDDVMIQSVADPAIQIQVTDVFTDAPTAGLPAAINQDRFQPDGTARLVIPETAPAGDYTWVFIEHPQLNGALVVR